MATESVSWDDGAKFTGVRGLRIAYEAAVHSIQIEYDSNGKSVWSEKHGGAGGANTEEIKLNYPDEYLVSVSGFRKVLSSENIITSLTIQSNTKTYGPFGFNLGTPFLASFLEGHRIVGFHGKSGDYLNSIEPHFAQPDADRKPVDSDPVLSIGPYGGSGGLPWDDGKDFKGVKQIEIGFGDAHVISIRIEYDDRRSSYWSDRHGGDGRLKTRVKFDYPNEYLVSVRGFTMSSSDKRLVQSLTFETNMRLYGPYGPEKGGYLFSLSAIGKKIVGFKGRSGALLDALGAYLGPDPNSRPQLVGPFGNSGGSPFDDGIHDWIKQIKVAGGDYVDSITTEYVDNRALIWSDRHGGSGGTLHTISLQYPQEFPISVSGYYVKGSSSSIGSLTITSNMRTYGPFGKGRGNYFSFPTSHSRIVGFTGRSGLLLDSIGGYALPVSPTVAEQVVNGNAVGGSYGVPWDDGSFTTVRKMEIWYSSGIDSVRIEYDNNGRPQSSDLHGSNTSGKLAKVELDFPGEFIVTVSGYYSPGGAASVIQSLTIETNKKKYGPFGTQTGTAFSFSIGSMIVGFHGRSGDSLSSIGVHAKPIPMPSPYDFVGPFGGTKGGLWDHGIYTTIRKIELTIGGHYIDAIRIEYDLNGRSVWSPKHGGSGGQTHKVVELNYPSEILTSVSGYYDTGSGAYVRSLTFKTNRKTYGPFGHQVGNQFSFPKSDGKIVGFHGRSGLYLDSIGGYIVPIPVNPPIFVEAFGGEGGDPWDDGAYDGVTKIVMNKNYHSIVYIHIEYVKNGVSITSLPLHGGNASEDTPAIFEINYPEERLLSISGSYDWHFQTATITSLAFTTNKRTLGPYGPGGGTKFSTEEYAGEIVGFHGRSGSFLDAIGVYLKPSS